MYLKSIMEFAINLAENSNSVPVAAVITLNNQIISYATNSKHNIWEHAELLAIQNAQNVDLSKCEIYITLEPCMFCSALLNITKIQNIYFGAYNRLDSGLLSLLPKLSYIQNNSKIIGGLHETSCQHLLTQHFERVRG